MQIAPEYQLKNLTKIAHFVHHSRRKSISVERGRQSKYQGIHLLMLAELNLNKLNEAFELERN